MLICETTSKRFQIISLLSLDAETLKWTLSRLQHHKQQGLCPFYWHRPFGQSKWILIVRSTSRVSITPTTSLFIHFFCLLPLPLHSNDKTQKLPFVKTVSDKISALLRLSCPNDIHKDVVALMPRHAEWGDNFWHKTQTRKRAEKR